MGDDNFDPTNPNPTSLSIGEKTETTNFEGGEAYEPFTPEFALYKKVLNNLLEDQFYESGEESFRELQGRFQRAANESPEFPLQLAVHARHDQGLRDVSQVLLVLSANHDEAKQYVRQYAPAIIDRTDEFNTVIAYQLGLFGTPVPKPLQTGIEDALHEKYAIVRGGDGETERHTFVQRDGVPGLLLAQDAEVVDDGYVHDEYTFSKYLQRDNEVSLHDVLNLCHPAPRSENRQELFQQIVKGELDEGTVAKEHWEQDPVDVPDNVDPLRQDRTWESERSSETTTFVFEDDDLGLGTTIEKGPITLRIEDDATPHYSIEGDGEIVDYTWDSDEIVARIEAELTDAQEWRHRLDDMGLMARTRNLRNMLEAGLTGAEVFDFDDTFGTFGPESERLVREHQMFPFRYYQAYRACSSDTFYDVTRHTLGSDHGGDHLDETAKQWLVDAMDAACANVPDTFENTFVAIDLSGSMMSPISLDSQLHCAEIASLFGAILAKRGCDVGVFATDFGLVETTNVDDMSVFDVASEILELSDGIGGGTNGWRPVDWAVEAEEAYGRFVFLTDLQLWDSTTYAFGSGSKNTLKGLWDQYTETVAPEAHLYTIDLASYGSLQMPEGYHNVHQIGGWTEDVLEFVDRFEQADDVVDDIEAIEPEDY